MRQFSEFFVGAARRRSTAVLFGWKLTVTFCLAICGSALAQNVTATLALSTSPYAMAVNHITNRVYVTHGGSVSVIDGATNALSTIAVGGLARGVAVNPVTNRIYVVNNAGNNVAVIDGVNNTVIGTVAVGLSPQAIAVNHFTNRIYVANYADNTVTVIDGSNNSTTSTAVGSNPLAVAVNQQINRIYVANEGNATVSVIDGGTNGVISTLTVASAPRAMAINPANYHLYVVTSSDIALIIARDNSNTVASTGLTAGGAGTPHAMVVNPTINNLYVTRTATNQLSSFSSASGPATGINPRAIALNPVTNRVYVANQGSGNVTVHDGGTYTVTKTLTVGTTPVAVAVNPVTNRIYVANEGSNNVTVIDGASNAVSTVAAQTNPRVTVVNPITNRIYVVNNGSNSVTAIDGANNTNTIAVGTTPVAAAVNPVTNRIYVANNGSNNVSVIDGATHSTITVPVGTEPTAVAVNLATNRIYVTNWNPSNVSVIDGATHAVIHTIAVGGGAAAVAVNAITNRIYVANYYGSNVSVIDGVSNSVIATIGTGFAPMAVSINPVSNRIYVINQDPASSNVSVIDGVSNTKIADVPVLYPQRGLSVNPVTNRIYVTSQGDNTLTIIDGVSNSASTIAMGAVPWGVEVNPLTNRIYVTNYGVNTVSVIDGVSNTVSTVAAGTNPIAIAVNPVTNRIYASNSGSGNVSVLDAEPITMTQSATTVSLPGGGQVTTSAAPALDFALSGAAYAPNTVGVRNFFYRLNDSQGTFTQSTGLGFSTRVGALSALPLGLHYVPAYVADSFEMVSISAAGAGKGGTSTMIGRPTVFAVVRIATPVLSIDDATVAEGNSGTTNATFTVSLSNPAPSGGVTFSISISTANGTATAGTDYVAQSSSAHIPAGSSSFTFTVLVNGDTQNEINETFLVNVTSVTGATISDGQGLGTITNDDPLPALSIGNVSVIEGNSGTTNAVFTVSLSAASGQTVTVNYATANGTAVAPGDFTANSGALTYTPGQTTQTISVVVNGDSVQEATETFTVNLVNPSNAVISGAAGIGTATIINDDVPITLTTGSPLPTGNVGSSYTQNLSASGGTSPYSFAITAGALPSGLSIVGDMITGTPTAFGTYNFTITATDSSGVPGPYSGSRAYILSMARGAQSIAFDPLANKAFGDAPFTLSAIGYGGSGNPVNFTSQTSAVCTTGGTNGSTATLISVGTCTIRAALAGNANYDAAADVDRSFTVGQGSQTIAFGEAPSITISGTGTVSATGGASGNPVIFTSTTTTVCTVSGSNGVTVTGVSAGTCAIAADQAGNANYSAAPQVTQSINVPAPITFTVTPSASANGAITPAVAQTVTPGASIDFNVTPNAGYTAVVDGSCGGTLVGNTFTTNAITADCTVSASFTLNSYRVMPSAGANGSISPNSAQSVNHGATQVFMVTPNAGYSASVDGSCGGTLVGNTYTTDVVTEDCTVDASFSSVPGAPQLISVSPLDQAARISFNAPSSNGGSVILDYTASCTPGPISNTLNALVIDVGGLTNNVAYRCSVRARNAVGLSVPSGELSVIPGSSGSSADLSITKTNSSNFVNGGAAVDYTITVTNPGPAAVIGARVEDAIGAGTDFSAATWTCTPLNNAACPNPASGSGALDVLVDLPMTASVRFVFSALPNAGPETPISNIASVTPPANITDANPNNNVASDGPDARGIFRNGLE